MVDLTGELAVARAAITDDERAELIGLGIPERVVDIVGAARIDLDREARTYQPLQDIGDRVLILGIRVGCPDTPEHLRPEAIAYCGALIDLLAWHPSTPGHWALRLDIATWLGSVSPQVMSPEPVSVRRSPLSWLRAGATGLCILTRDQREAQQLLLRCRGGLTAEDDEHATELRHLLERPFPIPPITVAAKPRRARAA